MNEKRAPIAALRLGDKPLDLLALFGHRGTSLMQIDAATSPELAIKIAYDFARNLRSEGASPENYPSLLLKHVEEPYGSGPLYIYVRAGFGAGFNSDRLPWRRQIEMAAKD